MANLANTCLPRLMRMEDVPQAMQLSEAAGWNQTQADWTMLLEIAPAGCFVVECDNRIVASVSLVSYAARLAWLGMVLTLPAYRGRGFARTLVQHVLVLAEQQCIPTVKLDATEQGLPIYRKLGFEIEQKIERWSLTGREYRATSVPSSLAGSLTLEQIINLDAAAIGAPRTKLLHVLAQRGTVSSVPDGFLLSRPGRNASYLGPCTTGSMGTAEAMIEQTLKTNQGPWLWDVLEANAAAAKLARTLGFERSRTLMRMVRGSSLPSQGTKIWATAGFEVG